MGEHLTKEELVEELKYELEKTKDILLNLECGLLKAEDLALAPNFYIAKKERIEALLWAFEVESRAFLVKKEKAQNAET